MAVTLDHRDEARPGPTRPTYGRAPEDALSALVAAALSAIGIVLATAGDETMVGFQNDVLAVWNRLPDPLGKFTIGTIQVLAVIYPVALAVVLLVNRQVRTIIVEVSAGIAATLAMVGVDWIIDRQIPPSLASRLASESWFFTSGFPDTGYLAAAGAVATVLGRYVGRRWGRAGWYLVVAFCLIRLVSGTDAASDIVLAVAVGWLIGSLVLLIAGSPDLTPTRDILTTALTDYGFEPVDLALAPVEARGSMPWVVELADGRKLFVKVLGHNQRGGDLLFRLARFIRLKNVGDEQFFSSLRRAAEHEALVSLKARDDLVNTPRLLVVSSVDPDAMMLVFEAIDADPLDSVDPSAITDDALESLWMQVALLHQGRIAHRDLCPSNLMVDRGGTMHVVDFGFSELAATDMRLAQDTAELLASTSLLVGSARTVTAAVAALGADQVGRAETYLRPLALSGPTRRDLHQRSGALQNLRDEVQDQCGLEEVDSEPITRIRPRTIFLLAAVAVALYVLAPQLADVGGMVHELRARQPRHRGAHGRLRIADVRRRCHRLLGLGAEPASDGPQPVGTGRQLVRQQDHPRRGRRHGTAGPVPAAIGQRLERGGGGGRRRRRRRPDRAHRPDRRLRRLGRERVVLRRPAVTEPRDRSPDRRRGHAGRGSGDAVGPAHRPGQGRSTRRARRGTASGSSVGRRRS